MIKRAGLLLICFFLGVSELCALDVTYGALFQISGIELKKGRPVLPIARGKYTNVRVLDKAAYDLLKTCASSCKQDGANGKIRIHQMRMARSRPDMWIADVAVDEKWLLTFLVFKKKDSFDFSVPQYVQILQPAFLARVKQSVQTQILQTDK